ncbi:sterol desaturase family protein [Burkholderia cepacia]|uniref:sterol desaturase family protein n=1 Tax=Burkholderia cepacia TaxID=292 RepID=UPI001C94AB0B|nr:sterol desaturase family protein [Burkholderia cepacia]MBY4798851.1 sterol desaturase family protein [Burkholderia cepacia]
MLNEIWSSVADFYDPTIGMLRQWAWGLPIYFVVVAWVAFLARKEREPVTLRAVVRSVFPKDQYDHASARVDRWNGIILLAIGFPLSVFVAINAISVADNLAGFLATYFGVRAPLMHTDWKMVAVQFAIYFLALDFSGYWVHRWCHEVPVLWPLHKPHHTAETLTPWTLFRQHPVEFFFLNTIPSFFAGVMLGLLLYATGTAVNPGTVTVIGIQVYVSFFVVDTMSHVHVHVSYGNWVNRIVLAPVMHNLHHSIELPHRDKNYGVILTVWDWMFGTLYLPKKNETWRWGLNEVEFGEKNPHKTLRGFYLEPFVSFWQGLLQIGARQDTVTPTHE